MVEEPTPQEQEQIPPGEQDHSPPGLTPEEIQEAKSWKGRLEQEHERRERSRAQLRQRGYDIDPNTGDVVPLVNQGPNFTTESQQAPEPTDEADEYYADPVAFTKKHAGQIAQQMFAQALPGLVGLIDETQKPLLKMVNNDWDDIEGDVVSTLRDLGLSSITHAKAVNPKLVDLAIQAARGKRVQSEEGLKAEQERRARLAAAATGSGTTTPASSPSQLTAEQQEEARQIGLSDEDYLALISQPVVINVGKKEGQ